MDTPASAELADRAAAALHADSDGHPAWRMSLAAMFIAQLLAIIGFAFVMPFIPFFIRELGVTDPRAVVLWAGWAVTASGLSMAVAAPFWGWVADHYGRKAMVQRAMFGGAVVMSLMGLSRNVYQLVGLRLAQGAITGTMSASAAMVSSIVPRAQLGFSLGLMQVAVFSGNSVGPYIGGITADHFGYRVPFTVTGGLLLVGGLVVLFGARERFVRPVRREAAPHHSLAVILRVPGAISLLCVFALLNFSSSFVGPIMPLYVEDLLGRQGQAASATGLLLAITGITCACSAVCVGRLSDRHGHKRVLVICTVLAALLCFPQAAARSVPQLLVIRALFGLGAGGMAPSMNALVAKAIPRQGLGQAYGLTATASAMGWATGPAIGGWAASLVGFRCPFAIMGGLLLLAAMAVQVGVRER